MTQHFIILCRDRKDAFALRANTREAHLDYLKAAGSSLFLAGPMLDEDEKPVGSMLIIEVENYAEAQAFADGDPYARAGLFAEVDIQPYRAVTGVWLSKN